ncbi:DUF11 domain-containing protein [Candidatus Saccharibacteria bacterium]|nr:DUF11 domain-containing protein [Candidatus Saccharibacteria bacterium]
MSNVYKTLLGMTAVAAVAAVSVVPAKVMAWGDSANGRPSYTLDQINKDRVLDKDKVITFNSISNSTIGDEKNFVGAKVANTNVSTWNADTIKVQDGQTYTIRLYVHNNSPLGEGAIATGVKANFSLPTTVSKSQTIIGYINADNAAPKTYWDEVTLTSDDNFYLEYVGGSAKYNNNLGTFAISNDVITANGAKLGYEKMDGNIPGCFKYSGVLTIDVKVHKSVSTKLTKQVRIKGTKDWSEVVDAKIGDEVEYQIAYTNLLAAQVDNVMIRDVLPTNVTYVADSTYLYNSNYQSGVRLKDNTVVSSGINIGSYATNGNAYVRFTGKVTDKTLACGKNQLVNWASATVNGEVYKDDASVMVVKDGDVCKEQPVNPQPTPDNPTPTPTPSVTPASTPTTIVNTGAESAAGVALSAGGITTALGYAVSAIRKKLH